MNLGSENVLWVLQWFPVLFDSLMVVLLLAGLLLLWLSLRSGQANIATVKQTAECDVEARRPSEFGFAKPAAKRPKHRANSLASPLSEARSAEARPGPSKAVDQNSDVARVGSAYGVETRFWSEQAPDPAAVGAAEHRAHALVGSEGRLSADARPQPGSSVAQNSLGPPVSGEPRSADAGPGASMAVDQNSYAGRVALAMTKSRRPPGELL
jgi:hypothetical protein